MSFLSNFRKTFFVYAISLFLVAGAFLLPQVASATVNTIDELRSQIQALLAQIVSLQEQISRMSSTTPPTPSCVAPTYNLYLGLKDDETEGQVTGLQKFLARYPDIYPDAQITGYFGPLTEQAVKRFQAKHGIVSSGSPETTGYGVVGPATRAKIRELCGTPTSPPIPVPPPPSISLTITNPLDGHLWTIGDTQTFKWSTNGISNAANGYIDLVGSSGTYRVYNGQNKGGFTWDVGIVNESYIPTGAYSVKIVMDNIGDIVGPLTIAPRGSTNLPPTISGVSGPTVLNIGQSGTWSVNARDPENGLLTYSVNWGDNEPIGSGVAGAAQLLPASQTATFTHTYTRQGVFNPIFTVTDNGGLSERTSVSVNVGGISSVPSLTASVSMQNPIKHILF